MGLRDRGYRKWDGRYTSHSFRWWTITKAGFRTVVSNRPRLTLVIIFLALAWLRPLVLILLFVVDGGRGFGRSTFFEYFDQWQWLFAMLMAGFAGAPLISDDVKSKAMHIYLSKPLRRADYLLGKLGAILLWLSLVTLAPALVLYIGGAMITNDVTRPPEMWEILGEVIVFEILVAVVYGLVILAISAASRKWTFALAAWIGGFLVTQIVAGITSSVSGRGEWRALGLRENLGEVARAIFQRRATELPIEVASLVLVGVCVASIALIFWRVLRLEAT